MWPLRNRRVKKQSALPVEVQQFSQSERRERMGMAWMIGLVSLVITIVLFLALFFGGRWVYRKITHKPNTGTTHQPTKTGDTGKTNKPVDLPASPAQTNQPAANTPAPATTTPPSTANTPAPSSNLPNTGPGDIDL